MIIYSRFLVKIRFNAAEDAPSKLCHLHPFVFFARAAAEVDAVHMGAHRHGLVRYDGFDL